MSKQINTFWTKFDTYFYRIKDNTLYQAPINSDDTVDTNNSITTTSISSAILENINQEFGSKFTSKDFT